jgi:hypothetical protein
MGYGVIGTLLALAATASAASLSNDRISADFNDRGLASLHDEATRSTYHFSRDDFEFTIDGRRYDSGTLPAPERSADETRITFTYREGPFEFAVVYELRPGWRFLSKQIAIAAASPAKFRVDSVTVFHALVNEPVKEDYVIARAYGDYGACLRFDRSRGLLVAAQNPFLAFQRTAGVFSLSYKPEMSWDIAWGPFEADRGLLAPYQLAGDPVPDKMLPEWQLGPAPEKPGMDQAEIDAFSAMVREFLLYKPTNPLNIMVGWCANDYQVDIATPEGRAEYKRLLDAAYAVGAEHVLFAPANSAVSRRSESRDDWHWENVLWLGMGEKIRRNEWNPATGPIPASVQEMLDYARGRNLGIVAYVYPIMGFTQNPEWLLGAGGTRANLGVRALQDWLIASLEGFLRHTGISGYAFDHTFLNLEGTSKYAQWFGWRRVLETLRRDIPDIVIDGRQAYQNYGPWIWLAGSYPHPTSTDEQPESFVSFPDLKLDRVSADRERYTAYRYRQYEFAPSEIVPGFITHQTARNDDTGHMPSVKTDDDVLVPFRRRDWDYLGWRYSLLSSIAVAGWNNVIDMIPARDQEEFRSFSTEDRHWFQHWIDWSDANKEYLRRSRPILGQPALGKIDGMAGFVADRGVVFLFNPNGRRMEASFTLDNSIGLARPGKYVVRELYPLEGRLVGRPGAGYWSPGNVFTREMDGGSALVLEIEPAEKTDEPLLFNSPGRATIDGGVVHLTGVRGEAGTTELLQIALPGSAKVTSIEVGKTSIPVKPRTVLAEATVTFEGERFHHYQQIDSYRPEFTGGKISAGFSIPERVFNQLAARRKAWPIPWTREDLRSTWLAPERLLLFVQIAEPDDRWTASLKIDGAPVLLQKAYASVRANRRNFTGFYVDVTEFGPGLHHLELEVPTGLKPGQYQGVFFENVEPEYTGVQ